MKVTFNGRQVDIEGSVSVLEFIEAHGYKKERIAVEINEAIVPKKDYDTFIIKENDTIEVLSFVGGG